MTLVSAVHYWLGELGIADRVRVRPSGRIIEFDIVDIQTKKRRDLTSVGVGASQILPVVVLCLLAEPGDLVLLEQPELHLHPKPQQILGDFLLGIAQTGRQLIVETHSEYLVNRLRRRIVEQGLEEEQDLIRLLYAKRAKGATSFEELRPNKFGSFDEWPEGFFDQSPRESEEIVRAAAARRRAERSASE
jgi:predicted ATPase